MTGQTVVGPAVAARKLTVAVQVANHAGAAVGVTDPPLPWGSSAGLPSWWTLHGGGPFLPKQILGFQTCTVSMRRQNVGSCTTGRPAQPSMLSVAIAGFVDVSLNQWA
mmetsp:Transcript_10005/g.31138  ORF Transcript_10005/g.31138 Transcript_10005/m.31138 type:complete len:108 (-) Transcript_10005:55-378(-)